MHAPRFRRRKPRVLLVPNQWSGSVQEYYHFLLGYLGPVLVWREKHPDAQIAMRDCGPMQPWIDTLLDDADLVMLNPGAMLHLFAGKVHRATVLRGFDDPQRFDAGKLRAFRDIALRKAGIEPGPRQHITVIDRATAGEFNETAAAEVPASGAAVRSVPNLRAAIEQAGLGGRAQIMDAAHVAPRDQMTRFAETGLLIGQHGAGLANMLWMPAGSTVVEILPPSPPWVEPIFTNLATALGHRIHVVRQEGPHAPVDVDALARAVSAADAGAQ